MQRPLEPTRPKVGEVKAGGASSPPGPSPATPMHRIPCSRTPCWVDGGSYGLGPEQMLHMKTVDELLSWIDKYCLRSLQKLHILYVGPLHAQEPFRFFSAEGR